jgi:hypothetical protein
VKEDSRDPAAACNECCSAHLITAEQYQTAPTAHGEITSAHKKTPDFRRGSKRKMNQQLNHLN